MGVILASAQVLGRLRERTVLADRRVGGVAADPGDGSTTTKPPVQMSLKAGRVVAWDWDLTTDMIYYSDNARALAQGDNLVPYSSLAGLLQMVHAEDSEKIGQAANQYATGRPAVRLRVPGPDAGRKLSLDSKHRRSGFEGKWEGPPA